VAEEERDKLEKEVTQLRSQEDQVPAAVQQNGYPVAHIKSESELNKVAIWWNDAFSSPRT
ncbi:uncharacterized protein METZ01_LOCUS259830, partial [marine metagenome]